MLDHLMYLLDEEVRNKVDKVCLNCRILVAVPHVHVHL